MRAIDRPYRFTWHFVVVWALLVVPTFFLVRGHDVGPWYSKGALLIVVPLFATFVLYGPVLLMQVIRSGSRGWFVVRVFFSIVFAEALLFGGLVVSGFYTESMASIVGFLFTAVATAYLNGRLERGERQG